MKHESLTLRFFYRTKTGRIFLKRATSPHLSKACGKVLDSKVSKPIAHRFARKHNITKDDFYGAPYSTFNDCFTRKIHEDLRPIDEEPGALIAPCDGHLSVYRIHQDLVLPVKQSRYSVADLLENEELAKRYDNGICMVFRLAVDNYHRYCYIDDGVKGGNTFIPGELHTVRPIALRTVPVFTRNSREYTVMETKNFKTVTQIEVGALLVGKILNFDGACGFTRGQEKGMFQYGGSTVILLLEDGAIKTPEELLRQTARGIETPVMLGEKVANAVKAN